jgi:hypothetical protein
MFFVRTKLTISLVIWEKVPCPTPLGPYPGDIEGGIGFEVIGIFGDRFLTAGKVLGIDS